MFMKAKWCLMAAALGLVGCNGAGVPASESEAELRASLQDLKLEMAAQEQRLRQLESRVSAAEAANATLESQLVAAEPQRLWIPWNIRIQYHGPNLLMSWGEPQPLDALPSRTDCLQAALHYVRANTGDEAANSTVFRYGDFTYEVRCLPEGTKPSR